MKIKLFSDAHIQTAKQIFPEKDLNWFNQQWTDAEINTCKAAELKPFIDNPSLITYPKPELLAPDRKPTELQLIVNNYIGNNKTFLSVGCGLGETEMWLAKQHPDVTFTAIDNAPYVEGLNKVASELRLNNITFIGADLKTARLEKFDVVYSYAVIYCIADDYLESFFNQLSLSMNKNGIMLVGCSSNFFLLSKLKTLIKQNKPTKLMKQTGWRRDVAHVRRYISKPLHIEKTHHFNHSYNPRLPLIIRQFSKRIVPISNASYIFVIRVF